MLWGGISLANNKLTPKSLHSDSVPSLVMGGGDSEKRLDYGIRERSNRKVSREEEAAVRMGSVLFSGLGLRCKSISLRLPC